jgi:hypothetical protein
VREIPDFRALVERHKNDPFAMIGINTDGDKAEYRKQAKRHNVNWRDAWQGSPSGPIPSAWGISLYPSNFVLDVDGRIRHMNVHGKKLEAAVSQLITEQKDEDA